MGLTRITSDGITDGTITGTDLATNVDLVDNQKLRLGTGNDLQIYHNGTTNVIAGFTVSDINIESYFNADVNIVTNSNHYAIKCISNAQVELYHDNSKKFETTSTGATLTGVLISDGLTLLDNEKILFGNNNDLEIFHNGTNNIIQSDVGDLQINSGNSAGDVVINTNNNVNNDTRVTSAKFIKNGSVELYHNGNRQVFTIDGGMNWQDNKNAEFGNSGDLKIYHDGTHSHINNATNDLNIECTTNDAAINIKANHIHLKDEANQTFIKGIENTAAVELYYGGSKKFETTANGVHLSGTTNTSDGNFYPINDTVGQLGLSNRRWATINGVILNINGGDAEFRGTTPGSTDMTWDQSENALNFDDNVKASFGNSDDLNIYHDGSINRIRSDVLTVIEKTDSEDIATFNPDGGVALFYDGSKKFETISTGAKVSGRFEQFGNSTGNNETNSGFARNVYNVPISSGTTKTFTFTGLNGGWATIKMGGYSSNGGSAMSFRAELGGWMFYTSTANYGASVLQNHQHNVSTSVTQNATSYVVEVTNNSSTNTEIGLQLCTEATQTAFAVAIS